MIDLLLLTGFLAAAVRVATPLALAALGEMMSERTGVINLGVEGAMLAGAFGAVVGATTSPLVGVAVAVAAGTLVSGLFGAFVVWGRTDQIITGTAVTIGATGLTGLLVQRFFGNAGSSPSIETIAPLPIPLLSQIPLLGQAFFNQSILTYAIYLLVPLAGWFLWRTRWGLAWRACGESISGARAAGVPVAGLQFIGTLIGGALAGLAGASLVLAQVGIFTERMTAGRGFIAIAIVVLGNAKPGRVAIAALVFGGATALQYTLKASQNPLPWQFLSALPYVLALVALGMSRGQRTEDR